MVLELYCRKAGKRENVKERKTGHGPEEKKRKRRERRKARE